MSKWVLLVILLQSVHCLQMQDQDPQCEKASLNLQRWATLVHSTHMINSAIGTNHSVHLGGSVYAETFYMSDNVHITKYEKTKQGLPIKSITDASHNLWPEDPQLEKDRTARNGNKIARISKWPLMVLNN